MSRARTLILVPMKDPARAKTRLADRLAPADRACLAALLFRRTLDLLEPLAGDLDARVAVVTGGAEAAATARARAIPVVAEPPRATLNTALAAGAAWAAEQGHARLCVIPADLAAPDPTDVAAFLASEAAVTVCPSADQGTNALLLDPPGTLDFRYGPRSAARHMAQARARGLSARLLPFESLSFDIDTGACLDRALGVGALDAATLP